MCGSCQIRARRFAARCACAATALQDRRAAARSSPTAREERAQAAGTARAAYAGRRGRRQQWQLLATAIYPPSFPPRKGDRAPRLETEHDHLAFAQIGELARLRQRDAKLRIGRLLAHQDRRVCPVEQQAFDTACVVRFPRCKARCITPEADYLWTHECLDFVADDDVPGHASAKRQTLASKQFDDVAIDALDDDGEPVVVADKTANGCCDWGEARVRRRV